MALPRPRPRPRHRSRTRARLRNAALGLALGAVVAAVVPGSSASAAQSSASSETSGTAAASSTVGPFSEPAFTSECVWHHFGEGEKPPLWMWVYDPLCVEYDKRDITIDNGGALRFLLAEPSRFAIAGLSCRYYQRDHWSVQKSSGDVPYVTWDGQYWWDKGARRAGLRVTNFRINGTSAGIGDAVTALRPHFPELAGALEQFGEESGESGVSVTLPFSLPCSLAG
ncbi:hypothetical protein [Streptomyces sp. NPDC047108]|uniref:hypothetical protein n=1 Tax=Streptomyces sp. NPDC047108 TaxID=3155025 RepID=UPI0033D60808